MWVLKTKSNTWHHQQCNFHTVENSWMSPRIQKKDCKDKNLGLGKRRILIFWDPTPSNITCCTKSSSNSKNTLMHLGHSTQYIREYHKFIRFRCILASKVTVTSNITRISSAVSLCSRQQKLKLGAEPPLLVITQNQIVPIFHLQCFWCHWLIEIWASSQLTRINLLHTSQRFAFSETQLTVENLDR